MMKLPAVGRPPSWQNYFGSGLKKVRFFVSLIRPAANVDPITPGHVS